MTAGSGMESAAMSERRESSATQLVNALERVRDQEGKKSNVRSTHHYVIVRNAHESAVIQEAADEEAVSDGVQNVKTVDPDAQQHSTASGSSIKLTSWKTQEFAYRKTTKIGLNDDDELPTLARGLFTMEQKNGQHRIVVRGYDKFFNEGELPWTKPEAIRQYSCAPYELSFKENGCIIFIAALSSSQLIVTSKHSLGPNESHAVSHAQKGEEWLDRHLSSKGMSKSDLSAELWRRNETAVAELCDDAFEEHVLAYPANRTGLHLHGLNANTVDFRTRPMSEVEKFAQQWGFLPTRHIVIESLGDVEKFCQSVAETGSWQGIPIEGFVVRTRMPSSTASRVSNTVAPPYKHGQTWFYKVKFDEPYLMYRDWRELTRRMLSDKQKYESAKQERLSNRTADPEDTSMNSQIVEHSASAAQDKSKNSKKKEIKKAEQARRAAEAAAGFSPPDAPQSRSNRIETKLFIQWCYEKLYGSKDGRVKPDVEAFKGFSENKGIIQLREDFIAYMNTPQGKSRLDHMSSTKKNGLKQSVSSNNDGKKTTEKNEKLFTKTLIVPIAIPGCGKTALAIALGELIKDFGHTQSDNVQTKKTAATFLRNIDEELSHHTIVFADRNNHLFKHRNEIIEDVRAWEDKVANKAQHVRVIALAWSLDALPWNALHHICSERIVGRGENHQSLRSSTNKEHEKILWNFLRQLQPFGSAERGGGDQGYGDGFFDHVIRLRVNASLEENLVRTYEQLASVLQLPPKDQVHFSAALERSRDYKVSIRKEVKGAPLPEVRYYGLSIELDLVKLLLPLLEEHPNATFALQRLIKQNRLVAKPHVTVAHIQDTRATEPVEEDKSTLTTTGEHARVRNEQGKIRWDAYASLAAAPNPPVFTMSVDVLAWDEKAMALGAYDVQSAEVPQLDTLQGSTWRPHITLGTFSEEIRPFEGDRVLRDADAGRTDLVQVIRFEQPVQLEARLKGMF